MMSSDEPKIPEDADSPISFAKFLENIPPMAKMVIKA
jgi:hypothetical protein